MIGLLMCLAWRATTEKCYQGKSWLARIMGWLPPAKMFNVMLFSEGRAEMNGHSSRSSRRERRCHRDSDRASSEGSERDDEVTVRRALKRKTARAAVNKIKLLEASDEDYEEQDEEKPRRSSSRLRHTSRASKRTAVIQSSSDSDQPSSQGMKEQRSKCKYTFLEINNPKKSLKECRYSRSLLDHTSVNILFTLNKMSN